MRIVWFVIAIFGIRFLAAAWFYPMHDADLAWQTWLGTHILHDHRIPAHLGPETFTASGAAWTPQEWLFSIAVALTLPFGRFPLLALAAVFCAALAFYLVALRAHRRGASEAAIGLTAICVGFAMLQSFGVRAQIAAWPLLAGLMLLLESEGNWIWLAVPLTIVWANLHASVLLAPALAGAWTIGTFAETPRWSPRLARNAALTLALAAATFCTPLLLRLPFYALHLFNSPITRAIAEWQPSDILDAGFALGVLPLVLAAGLFGIAAPRERWRDGMLFAATLYLAVDAVRNTPIFAIVAAPMVAARLTAVLPARARVNEILCERGVTVLLWAATAVAVAAIGIRLWQVPRITGVPLPAQAVASAAGLAGVRRLYCEDFAWCSLALLRPNLRTFVDGRCDPFPPRVWHAYLAIARLRPDWSSLLDRYRVDTVLASARGPLAQALASAPSWRLSYRDARYAVFVRRRDRAAAR